jgi:hypothetical protein
MATGTLSDFKVYEPQMRGAYIEQLTQSSRAFNEASRGAIAMTTESLAGQYRYESYFKSIASLISRRDTSSTAAATALKLEQGEFITVKLNRAVGPIDQTYDSFRKIAAEAGPEQMSFLLGTQVAKGIELDQLNACVRSGAAAIGADAANVEFDYTGTGDLTTSALVQGLAKMGDAADQVVAWVMHSKVYFDLVAAQISANTYEVAGTVIRESAPVTLGRPVIVSDSDALVITGAPDNYLTLGLAEGAAVATNSEQIDVVQEVVTGLDNLVARLQGEFAYNVGVKGYQWDVTNGGANPNDTALGTTTNWDKQVASHKDGPGVRIKTT